MNTIEQPKTALEAHNMIQTASRTEFQDTRFVEALELGEFARQGDLYIVRIDGFAMVDYNETENRQLAAGTTQGSRHILTGEANIYHPKVEGKPVPQKIGYRLNGPVFVAENFVTVEHPEHAHISLPAGTYQICHQVDVRTMKKVVD